LTESEIKSGQGKALFLASNPFAGQFNMAKTQLAKPSLSEALRAKFQKIADDFNEWVSKNSNGTKKLSQHYQDTYGKFVNEDCNYCLLEGNFEDSDGNHARIPVIKYVFKKD